MSDNFDIDSIKFKIFLENTENIETFLKILRNCLKGFASFKKNLL